MGLRFPVPHWRYCLQFVENLGYEKVRSRVCGFVQRVTVPRLCDCVVVNGKEGESVVVVRFGVISARARQIRIFPIQPMRFIMKGEMSHREFGNP